MTRQSVPVGWTPLARRADPSTSHATAIQARAFKERHIRIILGALEDNGPMTARQIAAVTPLDSVQVNRRGKEMQDDGLVTIGPDEIEGCRVWRAIAD